MLGSQAACPAGLKRLGSERVSIAFRGRDLGPVLLSTSVFLPVLTAALTAEKGLGYLLPLPQALKSLIRFQKWAKMENHSEMVRNIVGQEEKGAR